MHHQSSHTDSETLRRHLAATSAAGPHWSADGSALAFVWNDPGSYHVYVARFDASDRASITQVTSGDDRCTDPRFLATGELLYTSDGGGNENFQLFAATAGADGWWSRRLTEDDGAKYRVVSISDREMLFIANDRDRSRFTLYAQSLPLSEWTPRAIFTPERGVPEGAERLGDGSLAVALAYGNMSLELVLVEPEYRSLTAELSGDREVRWSFLREASDGRLLVATDLDSDRLRPVLLSREGSVAAIDAIDETIVSEFESSAYSRVNATSYLEFNDEGYSRLYCLGGLAEDAPLTRVELPLEGTLVAGDARTSRLAMSVAPRGDRIAVALSGPAEVANVWIGRVGAKTPGDEAGRDAEARVDPAWSRLTNASVPGIAREELADCTLARFTSFDGESVPYFTYLPVGGSVASTRPFPAVLLVHGGPEAQSRPAFNNVVQFLCASGFAVIVPNIRGSAGYGRRYLDLDNQEKRLDSIGDVAALARHVAATDDAIDGERLAVMGGSYGGFAVLSSLTEHPELWRAGVDIVGISNFVTFLENTAAWRRPLRESEYGSLKDRELLERISPINRIERITAPLLIIQGDNDERVPLSESIQMHERLRELGRTVELMRFADEGHGVTKLANRIVAYTRVAEWLREHLDAHDRPYVRPGVNS